jgi:hypothetical protein
MAQALLGGLLPAIYSGADQLKRGVYGLLTNPQEQAQRAAQSLLQSRAERQALMGQAFANPDRPFQVTDTNAMAQLGTDVLTGELGIAPIGMIAYHGSPAVFNKFDKSKIGSNSGMDYGYGGYFGELPETAYGYTQAINSKKTDAGSFYKVDIPDEYVPKMINWSSSQQSKEVNEILKKAGLPTNIRGEDIYFAAIEKAGSSDAQKSGFQKASEYLNSIGIKGISYPQRSFITDEVSKNFVVFDPTDVKILERNNQPVEGLLGNTNLTSIYHGTDPKAAKAIEKSGFDINKSADGTIWFTSNPEIGEVAATGKGAVVQRYLDENKVKLGGWDEIDKFSVDELIQKGYDGVKLQDETGTVFQIFNPEKLTK